MRVLLLVHDKYVSGSEKCLSVFEFDVELAGNDGEDIERIC
jgi:hypothetical protein